MKTPDDGLVAVVYAPCELHTRVHGTAVHVLEETDYPFRNTVRFVVQTEKPVSFPLRFRVPGWITGGATGARATLNGQHADIAMTPGTFARLERTWKSGDIVEISFPMQTRVSRWYNRSVALERGPLVFSLDPGESWVKLREQGMTADWQVFRKAPWTYALQVDEANAASVQAVETPIGARPFAATNVGVHMRVPAKSLDPWKSKTAVVWLSEDGVAAAPPASPVNSNNPEESLTLIPYGCAKLRVTAFPSSLS
jgi:hypothetical protein